MLTGIPWRHDRFSTVTVTIHSDTERTESFVDCTNVTLHESGSVSFTVCQNDNPENDEVHIVSPDRIVITRGPALPGHRR